VTILPYSNRTPNLGKIKNKMISYLAQASERVCTMEAFVLKRSSRVMPGKLTEKSKPISNNDIFFLLEVQNNVPEAEVTFWHDRCTQGTRTKSTNILSIKWFSFECQKVIGFTSTTLSLHKMFSRGRLYESWRQFGFQRHAFKCP